MEEEKNSRERILDVAFKLFANKAFEEVTIAEIAKQANLSTGGVFHYFDSKFEIAKESLFQWMHGAYPPILEKLSNIQTPKATLKELIDFNLDLFMEDPKLIRFFLELYEHEREQEEGLSQWFELYAEFTNGLQRLLKACDVPKPHHKAVLLVACIDGLMVQYVLFKGKDYWLNLDVIKEELYELFVEN